MDATESAETARSQVREAASLIRGAHRLTAFTGAGISVESGIPPFRGPGGLWGRYDRRSSTTISQNIDNLHYRAGSRNIVEFHGNSRLLACLGCGKRVEAVPALLQKLPPRCACGGIYKPDFIFFGEGIPPAAHAKAQEAARHTDVMLVVGSTGEVYPAALVPRWAAEGGATIIEINPEPSAFTDTVADLHLEMKAAEAFQHIEKELYS